MCSFSRDGASDLPTETPELHGEAGQPGEAERQSLRHPHTRGEVLQRGSRDPELHRLPDPAGRRPVQPADRRGLPGGFWDVLCDGHQQQRKGHVHLRAAGPR